MNDEDHKARVRDWRRAVLHMDRMVGADMINCVKAHYMVNVLLPRLAVLVGAREFTDEMSRMMARGLCYQVGLCSICKLENAVRGDDVCPACKAQCDALEADIERAGGADKYLEDET